jgi:hypothetical protein
MAAEKEHGMAMGLVGKLLIIFTLLIMAFGTAAPAEIKIEPSANITSGDLVYINGTGFSPGGTVKLNATVTCYKPVVESECQCTMENFYLPPDVRFKLQVREVTGNVTLYIKKGFWWEITPGLTSFFQFVYVPNTSTVTSGAVPDWLQGIYSIDVMGDAVPNETNCTMITSAFLEVPVDGNGNFSYLYNTNGIPICNVTIIGDDGTGNSASAPLYIFLKGDASKDGQINSYDCVCIARYVAGIPGYDENTLSLSAADVTDLTDPPDVNINDAKYLAEFLVGLHDL